MSPREDPQEYTEFPGYVDQDGNDVILCDHCRYWRANVGDLCDECAKVLNELP